MSVKSADAKAYNKSKNMYTFVRTLLPQYLKALWNVVIFVSSTYRDVVDLIVHVGMLSSEPSKVSSRQNVIFFYILFSFSIFGHGVTLFIIL